jgi:hypothetical protein
MYHKVVQLSLFDKNREPTNKDICMMCHLSSECGGCCKTCKNKCNSCQVCQIGVQWQAERLAAWLKIVEDEEMSRLRKFII